MKELPYFVVGLLISLCCLGDSVSDRIDDAKIRYGCKYRKDLCTGLETCLEDNLFGTCQNVLKDTYIIQFQPTDTLVKILRFSLEGLLELGYGWSDDYTQCIIGGLLESYELDFTPELSYCDTAEKDRISKISVSQNVDNQYEPSNRNPQEKTTPYSENVLSQLSDDDLRILQKYISGVSDSDIREEDADRGRSDRGAVSDIDSAKRSEESELADITELSATDEWLLEQLIKDVIAVDDLSSDQIKRLKIYLQTILSTTYTARQEKITLDKKADTVQEGTTISHQNTELSSGDKTEQDLAISELLRKFTAQSMRRNPEENEKTLMSNDDIIGQQISKQLKDLQLTNEQTNKYDKKSESVVMSPSLRSDKVSEMTDPPSSITTTTPLEILDTSYVWLTVDKPIGISMAAKIVDFIASKLELDRKKLTDVRVTDKQVSFQVRPGLVYNSTILAQKIADELSEQISDNYGVILISTGIGHDKSQLQVSPLHRVLTASNTTTIAVIATVLVMVVVAVIILITWKYMYRRWSLSINKFEKLSSDMKGESSQDNYEDLCRQRMAGVSADESNTEDDKISPLKCEMSSAVSSVAGGVTAQCDRLRSPRSSTSSWSEEPVSLTMDISTGHTVLSYMEDHLKNTERLEEEWTALCNYVPDQCGVEAGQLNSSKNRFSHVLPYDHNRVKLKSMSGVDYINASFISDHDPRSPVYISTQGPLQSTVAQFWQMIWEQECTSIVMLTSLAEDNKTVCHQYWPSEGRHTYSNFEVHLVSEHIWCEGYLVRSFYLKNLETNQTRTVTQFHYLSWPQSSVPNECKELLDFRRKVNKSYRGKTSPIAVCCSDGSSRSGTYILLDMVISRIHKGVKEVDIAATLEHIRDQRMESVQTREQFEFVLSAVAEEVQALLKALP